jgi:hypothetical protein
MAATEGTLSPLLGCHHPRMRMIQSSPTDENARNVGEYWMPRFRGA